MNLKRLASILALLLAFAIPAATASAAPQPVKMRLPVTLDAGEQATAKVNLGQRYPTVSMVCYAATFSGDLLDPGDNWFVLSSNGWGVGHTNIGSTSLSSNTVCSQQPETLALWLDGKDNLTIESNVAFTVGSFTLTSLSVTVYP